MKYTDETLFVLAVSEYSSGTKNLISGHSGFSNTDFCKLAPTNDYGKFQSICEKKIGETEPFYRLKDDIQRILDRDFDDSCDYKPALSESTCKSLIALSDVADGVISVFDSEFPQIYSTVKKDGDKPYLLFYKGDISLLEDLQKNVAVIGLLNPDPNIVEREAVVVKKLVECGMNIVSGLAKGCDTIAHQVCLAGHGKTIAILPSPLAQIFPADNRELAEEIVDNGGLLISEYYKKPASKFEATKRFIDRDRLQAMFSKAIFLAASYSEGMGDSGSRHAMGKAEEYTLFRAMLYDENSDKNNPQFGLNKGYHLAKKVSIMTPATLDEMIRYTIKCSPKKQATYAEQKQLMLG